MKQKSQWSGFESIIYTCTFLAGLVFIFTGAKQYIDSYLKNTVHEAVYMESEDLYVWFLSTQSNFFGNYNVTIEAASHRETTVNLESAMGCTPFEVWEASSAPTGQIDQNSRCYSHTINGATVEGSTLMGVSASNTPIELVLTSEEPFTVIMEQDFSSISKSTRIGILIAAITIGLLMIFIAISIQMLIVQHRS